MTHDELTSLISYIQQNITVISVGILALIVTLLVFFTFYFKKKTGLPPGAPAKEVPAPLEPAKERLSPPWLANLSHSMNKTRLFLYQSLKDLVNHKTKLDEDLLEKIHEILFRADVGVKTADKLVENLKKSLANGEDISWLKVRQILMETSLRLLDLPVQPLAFAEKPLVILVVGVNGAGKTTSIAKLASFFQQQQKSVLVGAADTFRAAAIDQIKVWGERLHFPVVAHQAGSDPAAVCYDTVKSAIAKQIEVVLIDTAGRLQNKENLMQELGKIKRVISRDLPGAPHEIWLVIDATTGQNAFSQVSAFKEVVQLNGLVVTKLDGTAKGGVLLGICDQYQIPIRFIGTGEKPSDLQPFNPSDFVSALFEDHQN